MTLTYSLQEPGIYFLNTDLIFFKDFIPLMSLFNFLHNFTLNIEKHLDSISFCINNIKLSFIFGVYTGTLISKNNCIFWKATISGFMCKY